MIKAITSVVSWVVDAGNSVVGLRQGTEEPHYDVVEQMTGGVQIRRYGPRIAAETTVDADENAARNAGFRRLAGYIFGSNHGNAKIAMTAPVAQQPSGPSGAKKIAMTAPVSQTAGADGGWVIRFFMPSDQTMESLPEANDPAVRLVTVPAETVAVLRFTGDRGPRAVASHTADLLHALQSTAFEQAGPPVAWFYDPPWTIPMLRRNEVAVPVSGSSAQ